ncbi:DUF3343 domain-containing protein [Gemella sp. GH3]|uniref:DUF3343 domain-containing protein n=1 Tax=unclassified Gemella TaxID=2624949 RepID=UPI0015D0A3EB|nr:MULTISPECIES: DUF3343 domain-containing protein [unclassified Gemella]MBF0713344.1 DUF3343 domain-containing protein [Gemella sp. GH3.1]NYS50296.1 DUF3343 domain-containing protein [Gemella sp. GH3]
MIEEGLIVFNSTHDAIKVDNLCLEKGIDASLIPTHPGISLGCGFMMKIEWNKFADFVKFLEAEKIAYKALYYSKKIGIKRETALLYENKN